MKKLIYVMGICMFSVFFSCNATTEDVAKLNKERDILDSTINKRQETSIYFKKFIESLMKEKSELSKTIDLLKAEKSGKKITYILGLTVSIQRGLELRTTDAEFEIPVSKEFYESAKIGQDIGDVSVSRTLSLSMHSADCQVTKKRTVISQ